MATQQISQFINRNAQRISHKLGLNIPNVPGIFVLILCDTVEELGHSCQPLLDKLRLQREELLQAERNITPLTFISLVPLALKITQRPDLGLEYGQRIDPLCSGLTGKAILTAPTLQEAAERGLRFARLTGVSFTSNIHSTNTLTRLDFRLPWVEFIPKSQQHFYNEMFLAVGQSHLQYLSGSQQRFEKITLHYTEPKHSQAYRDLFATEIEFGSTQSSLYVKYSLAQQALPHQNESLEKQIMTQCEDALAQLPNYNSWAGKVLLILRDTAEGALDLNYVAEQLNISPRTLSRHLEQEGVSYTLILNKLRLEQATQLLRNSHSSVDAIANEMGFSDASSFRKAFKKWAGKTPHEYRQTVH